MAARKATFTLEQIESVADRLTKRQLAVLKSARSQDHAYDCMARELRISVGTVKSRLSRARDAMASALEAKAAEERAKVASESLGAG